MRDSSWNTYTPPKPRSRAMAWLNGLGVTAVVITLLIMMLVGWERSAYDQAWKQARALVGRLATDQGILEVYRKNPALQQAYATEEAFLSAVQSHRNGLRLPDQNPPRQSRTLGFRSRLNSLQVFVRTEGGTWMEFVLLRSGAVGQPVQGEGIAELVFADSLKGLNVSSYNRLRKPKSPNQ